ncbi:hypothetical protein FM106_25425 [Brachybacterium faecium]|nr:hypothetical protein FM106_25425 [Brachybacterium faecium]
MRGPTTAPVCVANRSSLGGGHRPPSFLLSATRGRGHDRPSCGRRENHASLSRRPSRRHPDTG